jgi:hypothetical protein
MKNAVVTLLLFSISMAALAGQSEPPALVPHEIHSITITLDGDLVQLEPMSVTTDGRTLIRELAALVSRAVPGEDHKCRDIGEIRFKLRSGETVRIGLLPAHQEGLYDLRFYLSEGYSVRQIDRESLLSLLERTGIPARSPEFPG